MFRLSAAAMISLLLVIFCTVFSNEASARTYRLWGGQASFKLPAGAKVKLTAADKNFGDECLVTPSGRTRNVFGLVVREKLSKREQTMPFRSYAQGLKSSFRAEGVKAVRFSVDEKNQRVVMEIAGRLPSWVPVPMDRPDNAKVLGYFIRYRSGSHAFTAFTITTSKTWKNRQVAPYRKLVDSLRIRR